MNLISMLLVEDNPDDVTLIKEFLAEETISKFDIKVVSTLADAIMVMTGTDFNVVLLDLTLPDSTGLETVRQLVGRFPEAAVVVLTGLSDDRIAIQSVRYGAQDYIEKKHITSGWFGRAIRHAIERNRIMRQKNSLLVDLTAALEEIDNLQRILPICSNCKKICNENGEWETLETYMAKRVDADLNPSFCNECAQTLYPRNLVNQWK